MTTPLEELHEKCDHNFAPIVFSVTAEVLYIMGVRLVWEMEQYLARSYPTYQEKDTCAFFPVGASGRLFRRVQNRFSDIFAMWRPPLPLQWSSPWVHKN